VGWFRSLSCVFALLGPTPSSHVLAPLLSALRTVTPRPLIPFSFLFSLFCSLHSEVCKFCLTQRQTFTPRSSLPPSSPHTLQFVDAASGKTFTTLDPRTEEIITNVAAADKEDVNLAVKAARKAFESGPWRKMGGRERGKTLYRLADLMEQHKEELAVLETLDNGKPLSLSRAADVPLSIDHYR